MFGRLVAHLRPPGPGPGPPLPADGVEHVAPGAARPAVIDPPTRRARNRLRAGLRRTLHAQAQIQGIDCAGSNIDGISGKTKLGTKNPSFQRRLRDIVARNQASSDVLFPTSVHCRNHS